MRTIIILAASLIFFLIGLTLAGFPQGITNSGGFITGTSTNYLKLSGGGDMTLKSTTADRTTFGHVTVDLSGTDVYDVTIPDDSYISIDGNLSLSDTLKMKASSSGMASLITNGTITGSKAVVEQHLTQDQWHMVSPPVSAATSLVYNGTYLMEWDEPNGVWSFIPGLTQTLNVAEGYFVWSESTISSPTDVEFKGLLNTGNKTVTNLSNTSGAGTWQGWNMVGNPYPSAIEWTSSWTTTGLDATIYIWDGTNYKTWNYNLGGYGTKTDGSIPSTQGFWVKANSATPSMTIPNSSRVHSSQSFYKDGEATEKSLLTVTLAKEGKSDDMMLGKTKYASTSFDSDYDAYKMFGNDDLPQVYSIVGDEKLCVNLFSKTNHVIPVGVRIAADGQHQLIFEGLKEFDNSVEVYLKDKGLTFSNNKMINLRQTPEYTFTGEKGTIENRFEIHFVCDNYENKLSSLDNSALATIYSYDKEVYVNYQSDISGKVIIYNILGQEIFADKLSTNQLNVFSINFDPGYYIVKVISGSTMKSEKVYLN